MLCTASLSTSGASTPPGTRTLFPFSGRTKKAAIRCFAGALSAWQGRQCLCEFDWNCQNAALGDPDPSHFCILDL